MENNKDWPPLDHPQFHTLVSQKLSAFRLKGPIYTTPQICADGQQSSPVLPYQKFVATYLGPDTPYRALLVYHGLGSGKSRSAIEVIKANNKPALILAPASLKSTWMEEITRWAPDLLNQIKEGRIELISYNGNNLVANLERVSPLKDRVIVIDEVHNLISMIYNGGKSAQILYENLFLAQKCKIVALSATPLINYPYELGILGNILRGPVKGHSIFPRKESEFDRLYVSYVQQKAVNPRLFMARITGLVSYFSGIKDQPDSFTIYPRQIDHPIEEIPMSDYQFSVYYKIRMNEIRRDMLAQKGEANPNQSVNSSTQGQMVSKEQEAKSKLTSFRARSRQACNFVLPVTITHSVVEIAQSSTWEDSFLQEMEVFFRDQEELQKWYSKYRNQDYPQRLQMLVELGLSQKQITKYHLEMLTEKSDRAIMELLYNQKDIYLQGDNLAILSPKMARILDKLENSPGSQSPALIYSNYLNLGGLRVMGMVLEVHGYKSIKPLILKHKRQLQQALDKGDDPQLRALLTKYIVPGGPKYLIYSGDDALDDRQLYLRIFNHPLNKYRGLCAVFMGTRAAAEGLNLKNITQVHIMEPHWNEVRIQQVIGRARRLCSHQDLPNHLREVHIYRYLMIFSKEQLARSGRMHQTTDQYLYSVSKVKQKIAEDFLQLLKNGAVDCVLNWAHNADPENPIECFEYDYLQQGQITGDIEQEIRQQQVQRYVEKQVAWRTYDQNTAIKIDQQGQPILEWIQLSNGAKIRALVLYDLYKLKAGNKFLPVGALVTVKKKPRKIAPRHFSVLNI